MCQWPTAPGSPEISDGFQMVSSGRAYQRQRVRATNPKSARRLGRVQSCTHMVMMGIRVALDKVALDGRAVNELERWNRNKGVRIKERKGSSAERYTKGGPSTQGGGKKCRS